MKNSSNPHTLLVLARGAESAEDELGHLLNTLAMRHDQVAVIALDLDAAADSCLEEGPAEVLDWVREVYAPTLTVLVEAPEHIAVGPPVPVPVAIRTTRAAALAALRAWSGHTPEDAPPLGPDASRLRAALESALPAPAPAPVAVTAADRSPRVSMVITVFNQAPYLHQTIRSSLASEYEDHELVLVDDGSTDASVGIMESYAGHPRVRVVTHRNIGHTGRMDLAVNHGVREARGDLFAFLGGDDVNLPHRLKEQVAAFDADPELGICHSASWLIDPAGNRIGNGIALHTPYDDFSFLRLMAEANLVGHPTAMISRRTMERVGPYEDGIASDCQYWYKSGGRVRFRYLPQRLVEYRLHDRSLSTTPEGQERCGRSASRSRRTVLSRRNLADFFPELVGTANRAAWSEAAMHLGNALVQQDAALALRLYDEALEISPDPRLTHNRAVALMLLGDGAGAVRTALPNAGLLRESALLVDGLRAGRVRDVSLLSSDQHMTSSIADGRRVHGERARNWDGSPVTTRSAYVAVDPASSLRVSDVLADWQRHAHGQPDLRWAYPGLGFGTGADHDALEAAGVSVESVDDFDALPPDPSRITMVLRSQDDASTFVEWMSAA